MDKKKNLNKVHEIQISALTYLFINVFCGNANAILFVVVRYSKLYTFKPYTVFFKCQLAVNKTIQPN